MIPSPRVTIVVLNYNGVDHLDDCLSSLEKTVFGARDVRVVVADNASDDGSLELCRERYPDVEVLAFEDNLGFAAGNNRAAAAVDSDFVAFLNNDTRVEPGWIEPLVGALDEHADAICAGSRVLSFDGERQLFGGGELHFSGFGYQKGEGTPAKVVEVDEAPRNSLFATGCAMLVRRAAFLETGGFDDDFFAYYEDVDLGWRWWVLGHRVLYVPASVVFHKGDASFRHASSERKQFLWNRNVLCSVFKNYEDESLRHLLPAALFLTLERAMYFLEPEGSIAEQRVLAHFPGLPIAEATQNREEIGRAHLRSIQSFIDLLPTMSRKREAIQSQRRRSDSELFEQFPLELDFRLEVNDQGRSSTLSRLLPLLDLSGLWTPGRLDEVSRSRVATLDARLADRDVTLAEYLEELEVRARTIERWIEESRQLNEELVRIKSSRWFRLIERLGLMS